MEQNLVMRGFRDPLTLTEKRQMQLKKRLDRLSDKRAHDTNLAVEEGSSDMGDSRRQRALSAGVEKAINEVLSGIQVHNTRSSGKTNNVIDLEEEPVQRSRSCSLPSTPSAIRTVTKSAKAQDQDAITETTKSQQRKGRGSRKDMRHFTHSQTKQSSFQPTVLSSDNNSQSDSEDTKYEKQGDVIKATWVNPGSALRLYQHSSTPINLDTSEDERSTNRSSNAPKNQPRTPTKHEEQPKRRKSSRLRDIERHTLSDYSHSSQAYAYATSSSRSKMVKPKAGTRPIDTFKPASNATAVHELRNGPNISRAINSFDFTREHNSRSTYPPSSKRQKLGHNADSIRESVGPQDSGTNTTLNNGSNVLGGSTGLSTQSRTIGERRGHVDSLINPKTRNRSGNKRKSLGVPNLISSDIPAGTIAKEFTVTSGQHRIAISSSNEDPQDPISDSDELGNHARPQTPQVVIPYSSELSQKVRQRPTQTNATQQTRSRFFADNTSHTEDLTLDDAELPPRLAKVRSNANSGRKITTRRVQSSPINVDEEDENELFPDVDARVPPRVSSSKAPDRALAQAPPQQLKQHIKRETDTAYHPDEAFSDGDGARRSKIDINPTNFTGLKAKPKSRQGKSDKNSEPSYYPLVEVFSQNAIFLPKGEVCWSMVYDPMKQRFSIINEHEETVLPSTEINHLHCSRDCSLIHILKPQKLTKPSTMEFASKIFLDLGFTDQSDEFLDRVEASCPPIKMIIPKGQAHMESAHKKVKEKIKPFKPSLPQEAEDVQLLKAKQEKRKVRNGVAILDEVAEARRKSNPPRLIDKLDAMDKRPSKPAISNPVSSRAKAPRSPDDYKMITSDLIPPPKRTTRSSLETRARRRSPSPLEREPSPERWSFAAENQEWKKKWRSSIIYPPIGKKQATVDKEDIARLDEGEFLNDNLIVFYLRMLEEGLAKETSDRIYFQNTFFYRTLTKNGNKGINYEGVKRWTNKVDIFKYDYLIVPVNESLHWYVAIICNPAKLLETTAVKKSAQKNDQCASERVEGQEPVSDVPDDTEALPLNGNNDARQSPAVDAVASEALDLIPTSDTPLPKDILNEFYIITLDSLGLAHSPTVANLKDYLIKEIKDKQGLDVARPKKGGFTARGIPQQDNFCDCGLFLLSYVEAFTRDPDEFVKDILERTHGLGDDWGKAPALRESIRTILFQLQDDQVKLDAEKKTRGKDIKAKKSVKREEELAVTEATSLKPKSPAKALPVASPKESSPPPRIFSSQQTSSRRRSMEPTVIDSTSHDCTLQLTQPIGAALSPNTEGASPMGDLGWKDQEANARSPPSTIDQVEPTKSDQESSDREHMDLGEEIHSHGQTVGALFEQETSDRESRKATEERHEQKIDHAAQALPSSPKALGFIGKIGKILNPFISGWNPAQSPAGNPDTAPKNASYSSTGSGTRPESSIKSPLRVPSRNTQQNLHSLKTKGLTSKSHTPDILDVPDDEGENEVMLLDEETTIESPSFPSTHDGNGHWTIQPESSATKGVKRRLSNDGEGAKRGSPSPRLGRGDRRPVKYGLPNTQSSSRDPTSPKPSKQTSATEREIRERKRRDGADGAFLPKTKRDFF